MVMSLVENESFVLVYNSYDKLFHYQIFAKKPSIRTIDLSGIVYRCTVFVESSCSKYFTANELEVAANKIKSMKLFGYS